MTAVAAVFGDGLLADFVCNEIAKRFRVVHPSGLDCPEWKEADLVLRITECAEHSNPDTSPAFEQSFQTAGAAWLAASMAEGEGLVGPLVRPGISGCSVCAAKRRLDAGRHAVQLTDEQIRRLLLGEKPRETPRVKPPSRPVLIQLGLLIAAEARRALAGSGTLTEGRFYRLDTETLECSLHAFLPDPSCPVCGGLPDDTQETALIRLQPRPQDAAGQFRSLSLAGLKPVLAADYVDERSGLMNGLTFDLLSPYACAVVRLPFSPEGETAFGRSHSYADSALTAVLEGLERYCGHAPRGKRVIVRGSLRGLAKQALDPAATGLYTNEQYAQPGFPFRKFDPDRAIDWVWGYSFMRDRPILVPLSMAYYGTGTGDAFLNEGSNGCALGGSLEEAVLYGLLEVVERDSFLMVWYAQLPLPQLDPFSAGDRELALMVERLRAAAGFDVHLFDSTMENGIPAIWAVAKNRKPAGARIACAAGAHPDPIRAAKSALHELAGLVLTLQKQLDDDREDLLEMVYDSSLVRRVEDHCLLYGLPEAEARLDFLFADGRSPLRSFQDAFPPRESLMDLTETLKDVLGVFQKLKLEVIVVDQTAPEIARNGLHCVKVLVPGMLPMTYGHDLVRTAGLERLLKVPVLLGYADAPLTSESLNPYPHPFP